MFSEESVRHFDFDILKDKINTPVARYCPHMIWFRRTDIWKGKTKAADIKFYDLVHSKLNQLNLDFIQGFYKNDGMYLNWDGCQTYK